MDFERDWNVDAAADRQQAPDPGLAALAARVKAAPVQPGTLHTVTPNADGMVVLPAGTDIDKIDVDGRNLVVTLPDGTQMVILDGAVVVPRIVVGDVEIPSVNLAALLIGEEPQPAAGPPRSSGGNFLADDGAIGDPFGLGDLLPPTELQFSQPEEREILPIGPDDEPDVTIITPNQPAGATDATANVSEAGLGARNGGEPAGSAFGSNSHVTTGTIAVSAADGPALVTINGIAVTGADQAPIDTPLGMLIITGVGEDEISYRYVLKDNVVGIPPAEIFTVVVTDADGDQATATLTISIADDSPKAVNDVDSVTEDGPLTADGNVFSGSGGTDANATDGVADVPGADGVVRVTTGVFQGTYGELTLSGLGDYRYVLNNSNPAVQFLTPGQTLTETFTYSITDADNSPSNATLTITINGADDGVRITGLTGEPGPAGAELTLFENDLTDGSSPDASALVQGGTFSISAADGLTTVTVDGVAVLTDGVFMGPKVVTTALGTLTIDTFTPTAQQGAVPTAGTFTYHFTLTDNSLAHSAAGADDIVQSFTVVATDRNGSDDTASLDVRIVDDQPVAVDDVDLVPAGSYGPQAGNVITGEGTIPEGAGKDVKGADDAHVAGVVAGVSEQALDNAETLGKEVHGLYGKLILAADGHYDYMRDPGTPGNVSDTFTYTLRDGDGDLSIATLRIDIANSDVSIAPTIGEGTVVDESGLIEGKSPAPGSNAGTGIDMTQGVITYSAPDGPATITINDFVITKGTVIQTDKGELVIGNITGTSIEYSYSLTSNIDNSSEDPVTDDFKVTVTDVDGDSKSEILSITILDDRPMAVADVDSVKEDGPLVADGNVLTGGHGADANSTDGVADVQGADGAKVTGIAFGGVDHPVGEGVDIGGTYGTLHISAHGDYVYTLNNENGLVQGLDSTQTLTESFTYTITDNDPDHADRSQATLTITIAGNNDGVTIDGLNGEGAEEIVYEASLPGGSAQNSGALTQPGSFTLTALDGVKTVTIGGQTIFADDAFTGTTIKNAYGTLSIDDFVRTTGADGDVIGGTIKYHYVLDDNTLLHTGANDGSLTDSFAVVVLDTDESRAEASLDITVVDDRPFAIDDVVGQEVENTPVEFNVISGVGTLSANVDTLGADGVNLAINGDISWTDPAHGTLTYLGDGRFHYEQVPGAAGEDSFTYTITDGDKDSSTATVTILLAGDSTPTVTVGDLVVSEAGLPNGTQAAGDGEIASGTMAITTGGDTLKMVEVEGKDGWVDVTGATVAVPVNVEGLAGTLRVTSAMGLDGVRHYSYSYTLTTNDPTHPDFNPSDGDGISGGADEKAGDSFAVRVTDSDDDVSL
ncbi:MAG TPA: VCBS domain-containing protein, partial [Sphingobium sp.]|nr:VCBS domain-containing protein [Sphingobium sp.]